MHLLSSHNFFCTAQNKLLYKFWVTSILPPASPSIGTSLQFSCVSKAVNTVPYAKNLDMFHFKEFAVNHADVALMVEIVFDSV